MAKTQKPETVKACQAAHTMQLIEKTHLLHSTIRTERAQNKKIALVPTMGNLHDGHIALVKHAHQIADLVVASIFVNPMQFGANEDLANYPRTPAEDQEKLEQAGAHYLFIPDLAEIYPNGTSNHTQVNIEHLSNILCGVSRPVHFSGVCTVVSKLFNLVQPTLAVFGEKDYQQLVVIRRMTEDLCMPIEIVGVPTVREPNGLAMSSRNHYLTQSEKALAGSLYATLEQTRAAIENGERNFSLLCDNALQALSELGFQPDYFEIRNASDLSEVDNTQSVNEVAIIAAAYLGKTRLIDNLRCTLNN